MTLALPSQMTPAVGHRLTANEWNDDVRDAINYLVNRPIFRGWPSVNQSIPNNAVTAVALDSEDVDTYNGHSTSVNNSRYVCQVTGWHLIVATVSWPGALTGARIIGYGINSAGTSLAKRVEVSDAAASTTRLQLCCVGTELLTAGSYVEALVYQNSGAAVNITLATTRTSLSVQWLHA